MGTYRVTAPLAYARRTGEPSNGLGIKREVIRHDVGDIIELDDDLAAKFHRRLEWYVEPVKPATRPKSKRQPKPEPAPEPEPQLSDSERETDMQAVQAHAEIADGGESGGDQYVP